MQIPDSSTPDALREFFYLSVSPQSTAPYAISSFASMAGPGTSTGQRSTTSCGRVASCITCFYATMDWSSFGLLNGFVDKTQIFIVLILFITITGMFLDL
jgi:hypothetical protein